jgi:hypothetical protein
MSALELKKKELERRIATLPQEVDEWSDATLRQLDKNAHFSQLQAVSVLVHALTDPQPAVVAALDPANAAAFTDGSLGVVRSIVKAQKWWDFFREKLNQRGADAHKAALWTADTVAWNCHRPTMDLAVQFGIVEPVKVREPPLVYCTAEYSPATWVRKSRPNDGRAYALGETLLPIPVIEFPWDHLPNSWDYLSLHHEVGHDIEADLGLRAVMQSTVQQALAEKGTPQGRIATWVKWEGEIFADLCALRLAGPPFADTLMQLLVLPQATVTTLDPDDPHPTAYIRILLNAAYVRRLGAGQAIQDHAALIEQQWRTLYGATAGNAELDAYSADMDIVCSAMMNTALAPLKGKTVADLIPYTDADDARIRQAERFFRTGIAVPGNLRVRHVPSAARLAINALSDAGTLTAQASTDVHTRVIEYIRDHAPGGLRGGGPDAHKQFVASFAGRMFST